MAPAGVSTGGVFADGCDCVVVVRQQLQLLWLLPNRSVGGSSMDSHSQWGRRGRGVISAVAGRWQPACGALHQRSSS